MEETNYSSPRNYKKVGIDGVVVIKSKKYLGDGDGWMSEPVDFSELTYYLGYQFEPKSIHMFEAPKGVIRGGHLEGRSKSLTVARGLAFVVIVNMRPGENIGKSVGIYLGEGKEAWGNTILVSEGVLVALTALTDDCLFFSAADRPFNRFDSLLTLDMFDPKLKIKWPDEVKPQIVEPESRLAKLDEFLETL